MEDGTRSRWEPAYLPQLDGLRAVAVGLVLAYHLVRTPAGPLLPGAFLGVDVFFVLSGFLITSLLLGEQVREGGIRLLAFYRRRVWRLYPALVLVSVATLVACAVLQSPSDPRVAELREDNALGVLLALTYVSAWAFTMGFEAPMSHTWSLSVEEHFYLVWPVVLILLLRGARRHLLRWTVLLTAGAALWPLFLRAVLETTPDRLYAGPDTRSAQLLVGALLAVLLARPQGLGRLRLLASPWATAAALLVLAVAVATWDRKGHLYLTGGQVVLAAATAVLLLHLVLRRSALTRVLSRRPALALGRWSYGVYLWHVPLVLLLPELLGNGHTNDLVAGALAVTLAAASYRFVEQPLLRRYGGRRTLPESAPPAVAVPQQAAAPSDRRVRA